MNSFIINSKKAFRNYSVGLVASVVFSMAVPYAIYCFKPSIFYFRAFEYFDEIVYPHPERPVVWDGFEKGDASRKYFFRFQDAHHTHVACDADGFRSVPYQSKKYQILVCGDSQTWGSGLSDAETFPWRLAKDLNMPVFNGGRPSVELRSLLGKPELAQVKLIIQVIASHNVSREGYFANIYEPGEYVPLREIDAKPLSVRRFYPGAMIVHAVSAIVYELADMTKLLGRKNNYICPPIFRLNGFSQDTLKRQANLITKFSQCLNSLGYTYLLVFIPNKCLIYSECADEFSALYFSNLTKLLRKDGVHAVDIVPAFQENKQLGLFFNSDSHWTAPGTEIAVAEVAEYLRNMSLVKGLSRISADNL